MAGAAFVTSKSSSHSSYSSRVTEEGSPNVMVGD